MSSYLKLSSNDLNLNFNALPQFNTTADIPPYTNIIGQGRAVKSIDLGLLMNKKEYNIYISGPNGTGKTSYIINKIKEYAKTLPDPCDWCYVYNFKDIYKPLAIPLATGTGLDFKDSIKSFISELFKKVPTFFDSKNYENAKGKIVEKYEMLVLEMSRQIHEEASKNNFAAKQDDNGNFVFIPLNNGDKMDIETYNKLSNNEKDIINNASKELKMLSLEIVKKINLLNKLMLEELKNLDNKISEDIICEHVKDLKSKFGENNKVISYLDMLELDIIQNISAFLNEFEQDENDKEEVISNSKSKLNETTFRFPKHFFKRYDVNVIVTNKVGCGAPVIYEDSSMHSNLFGKIEYQSIHGNTFTDFTMIKPGNLHLANGGFLVLNAEQLLSNPISWKTFKKSLKCETIAVENSKNNMELFPIITLTPKQIPLKVKIILVGSNHTYSLLSNYDYDFNKLFKIKSEFDNKIENDNANIENILGFINSYITDNKLLHLTKGGVNELLKYSCKLSGSKNYFTAYMNKLLEIIDISSTFAKEKNSDVIDESNIRDAIHEFQAMHELVRKKVLQMYKDGKYIVNLKGSTVGQINGLSVMNFGDCSVGQQHRITVTTFAGKQGITNIEREANMSGNIHSKGIMILSGFIGEFIGQNTSLSFNARIVFEQLYSNVDGDSASAAELLALISSLSDIPIKQNMAITGSVNQKGEIQPIGGVNEKIEGYFDICSIFNLDGSHGVVIPNTNTDDLVLSSKVINSVEKGLFNIYTVKTIEDCISILFDFDEIDTETLSIIDFIKQRILNKLGRYRSLLKK